MTQPATPAQSPGLREAVEYVVTKFKKDEADGYHTKDREFAITILDKALAAQSPVLPPSGVEALDNSQSLLAMIYQLNTKGSVSEHDWETEGLSDLITKQIKENRAALISASVAGEANPVAWRYKHSSHRDWSYSIGKPEGPSIHLFTVEPLYAAPSPALDPGTVEAVCRRYLESALRWQEVFEDGRGGNDLNLHDTLNMMVERMLRALASPAPGNAEQMPRPDRVSTGD